MSRLPTWPEPIKRDGPYRVYKGHKYAVYDDGNSAETPYQTDLAEAALSRLRIVSPAKLRNCADCLDAGTSPSEVAKELRLYADQIGSIPE